MNRGKNIIIICGSEPPAGFSEPLFSWAVPPQSSRFARCQLPQGDAKPSQALPRQLSQGESQAVKFITKVLGAMRKLPAVLLPLPLRKDFPRPGEDVAQRQKGECGFAKQRRRGRTPLPSVLKCQAQQETLPPPLKPSPWGRWLRPAGADGRGNSRTGKLCRHTKKLPLSGELARRKA